MFTSQFNKIDSTFDMVFNLKGDNLTSTYFDWLLDDHLNSINKIDTNKFSTFNTSFKKILKDNKYFLKILTSNLSDYSINNSNRKEISLDTNNFKK